MTKTLFHYCGLGRKKSSFITLYVLICSCLDVHYLTWPYFVCTVLLVQNFVHSQIAIKIWVQTVVKEWLQYRQKCLQLKLLLKRLTSSKSQRIANRLLEWMLANVTLTQPFTICLRDSTQEMNLRQTCKNSSRLEQIQTFRNDSYVLPPTKETRLQSREFLHNRNWEKIWLFQWRLVL